MNEREKRISNGRKLYVMYESTCMCIHKKNILFPSTYCIAKLNTTEFFFLFFNSFARKKKFFFCDFVSNEKRKERNKLFYFLMKFSIEVPYIVALAYKTRDKIEHVLRGELRLVKF